MSVLAPIVLQNSGVFAEGAACKFLRCFVALSPLGAAASTHRRLTRQLCGTGLRRQWRWPELDEPPQVLRGRGEQDLVPRAAQASQPKPVEPEDALHMRKSHLDLFALPA